MIGHLRRAQIEGKREMLIDECDQFMIDQKKRILGELYGGLKDTRFYEDVGLDVDMSYKERTELNMEVRR